MSALKICPFCAEEIKLAAIVCKHCERELPGFEKQLVDLSRDIKGDIDNKPSSEKVLNDEYKKTPFQKGFKFANIMAVIGVIATLSNNYNLQTNQFSTETLGDLLIGLPFIYFVCLFSGAIIVWLFRKMGKFLFLSVVGLLLIIPLIYLVFQDFQNKPERWGLSNQSRPTPAYSTSNNLTPKSSPTPAYSTSKNFTPQGTNLSPQGKYLIYLNGDQECVYFAQVDETFVNNKACVYGRVNKQFYDPAAKTGYINIISVYPKEVEFRFNYSVSEEPDNLTNFCLEFRGTVQYYYEDNQENVFTVYPREVESSELCGD